MKSKIKALLGKLSDKYKAKMGGLKTEIKRQRKSEADYYSGKGDEMVAGAKRVMKGFKSGVKGGAKAAKRGADLFNAKRKDKKNMLKRTLKKKK